MEKHADWSDIEMMVADGMTTTQIAEDKGVSYCAARSALVRRRLVPSRKSDLTVYDRVQDMRPQEAVDYLLGVVEALEESKATTSKKFAHMNLTGREGDFLSALCEASPRTLSKSALLSAVYYGHPPDDWPDIKNVDVFVCKIRSKLLPEFGEIKTNWGIGYYFTPAEAAE